MRVPKADLDERDPDYIRDSLPGMWLLASLWFRGEVRGLGRIPAEGPVLMVGNHSGGNLTPDTTVFTLAFNTYFGVERRFYQLAHNLVLSMPGLGSLRKYGTVAASHDNANKALDSGAALLVYPGGDYEVHRPSWESAKVDFGGRKGFIRLALDKDVPLVPSCRSAGRRRPSSSAAVSGWPSCCASTRCSGSRCCRSRWRSRGASTWATCSATCRDRRRSRSRCCPRSTSAERYGSKPDVDEVYSDLMEQMQDTLTALQSERSLPVIG